MSPVDNREIKKLCMKNGKYCAICHVNLIVENQAHSYDTIVAEVAHIKGKKLGSARYDPNMSKKERDSEDNLILVCPTCHKKIDDQPETYTANKLLQIKTEYEKWVGERIQAAIIDVSFAELAVVTKYVASGQASQIESYNIIPPRDKIRKNGLSQKVTDLITMGMTQVKQVAEFIDRCPDIDFGNRLKEGFVAEYERLKNEEKYQGDDLFFGLLDFASKGTTDFPEKAAGLAILVYLFEKCEVFEK
jgi:endogenous inhibitor of DNA gyrase (YacG/DUF329 family)